MAFDGDLESLPITDLIQLLHATGKSGTLTLRGPKGESQLVFDAGFIVSANHVNNSVRIGRILIDMGVLTPEELERALKAQALAGQKRAPLVATLLEAGTVLPPQAYKGLEILIELTIVEVLTWSKGSFSFDAARTALCDEYRYFPETLEQQIHLNTQSVLMDALRIYDERKRDGTLMEATFFSSEEADPEPELSPELLGLDALDELESRPAEPFHGLEHQEGSALRQRVREALPGVSPEEGERLAAYLEKGAPSSVFPHVILLDGSPLTALTVSSLSGERLIAAAAGEAELHPLLEREGSSGTIALLVGAGLAASAGAEFLPLVERLCLRYPALQVYLLLEPGNHRLFAQALRTGVRGVIPWPKETGGSDGVVEELIASGEALSHLLGQETAGELTPRFAKAYDEIAQLSSPAEITLALLRFVSDFFPRVVTLVLLRGELVAEKGIGFRAPGTVSPVKLRIPVATPSILRDATEKGELLYVAADAVVRESLQEFGPPASRVLLLPVRSMGRVVAVLYADWGEESGREVPLPLLQVMAQHAGLVLDNALYRKRVAQGSATRA